MKAGEMGFSTWTVSPEASTRKSITSCLVFQSTSCGRIPTFWAASKSVGS